MTKSVKFAGENSVFAQRLKAIMKEKGVTQQQLAEQLHMTRQAVSLYLTGQALPAIDKLLTITDYFDVSADYLIGKTDVRTQDTDVKMICDYTGLSEKAVQNLNDFVYYSTDTANTELYKTMLQFMEYLLSEQTITENPYTPSFLAEIAYYEHDLQIRYQFIKESCEVLKKPLPDHDNRSEMIAETMRIYNLIRIDRADLKDRFEKLLRLLSDHTEDEIENMIRQIRNMSLNEGENECPQ